MVSKISSHLEIAAFQILPVALHTLCLTPPIFSMLLGSLPAILLHHNPLPCIVLSMRLGQWHCRKLILCPLTLTSPLNMWPLIFTEASQQTKALLPHLLSHETSLSMSIFNYLLFELQQHSDLKIELGLLFDHLHRGAQMLSLSSALAAILDNQT